MSTLDLILVVLAVAGAGVGLVLHLVRGRAAPACHIVRGAPKSDLPQVVVGASLARALARVEGRQK